MKFVITAEFDSLEELAEVVEVLKKDTAKPTNPTPTQQAIREQLGGTARATMMHLDEQPRPKPAVRPSWALKAAHDLGDKVGACNNTAIYRSILAELTLMVGSAITNSYVEGCLLDYFPKMSDTYVKSCASSYIKFLNESGHIGFVERKGGRKVWKIQKAVTKDTKFDKPL